MERNDPDPNPQIADQTYKTVADFVPNGTSNAPIKIMVKTELTRSMLKCPYLSPMNPGMTRPKVDPAPTRASRVYPFSGVKPTRVEMDGKRPEILKTTNSNMKIPAVTKQKAGDLKAVRLSVELLGLACPPEDLLYMLLKGMKQAMAGSNRPADINAMIRIDHCHPRLGYVERRIIGNMTAPMDDPARVIPMARPRLRTNSLATMAMATTIVIAAPILPNTPRHSMKCQ